MSEVFTIIDIDGSAHKVTKAGLLFVYGDKSVAAAPTLLADAEKIPDYGRNLKRPNAIRDRLHRLDYGTETRFDAAHGRRYFLLAFGFMYNYRQPEYARERRVVLAAADGITNLRQHHIDCGIPANELDAMARKERDR